MGMTAKELRSRMTVREFHEWIAYNRYEAALAERAKKRSDNQAAVRRPHRGRR